jgi:spermidine/putrescine transport system permease protein
MVKLPTPTFITGLICASYVSFLFLGPLLVVLFYSFHGRDYMGGITASWSLDGWRDVFSPYILQILLRSGIVAGANTILCILIGVPFALTIYRSHPAKKRLWFSLLVLPLTINALLVAYSWQVLLGNAGVINSMLLLSGLRDEPIVLLFRPGSVTVGLLGAYLPFFVAVFLTSLERLDAGYLQASQSLGANEFQTLRKVILPMSRPGLITGALLVFLPSFAEYVIPDLLGGGKTFLVGNLAQFAFYEGRNWPAGAALMVTTIVMLSAFMIPAARYVRGVFSE